MGIELNIWERAKVGDLSFVISLISIMSIISIMSFILILVFDSFVLYRFDVT